MTTRVSREWCYVLPPSAFEVAPCACGNQKLMWSEYEGCCWCERCQLDFEPSHAGIFDGPIPTQAAYLLGLTFDRINVFTGRLDHYDLAAGKYESEKQAAQGSR